MRVSISEHGICGVPREVTIFDVEGAVGQCCRLKEFCWVEGGEHFLAEWQVVDEFGIMLVLDDGLVQGDSSALRPGLVDFDFGHSTVCPVLLGLTGIWQKWLCGWARWWNTQIKVNPGLREDESPCRVRRGL